MLSYQLTEKVELDQKALDVSICQIAIDTEPKEISQNIYDEIAKNAVRC